MGKVLRCVVFLSLVRSMKHSFILSACEQTLCRLGSFYSLLKWTHFYWSVSVTWISAHHERFLFARVRVIYRLRLISTRVSAYWTINKSQNELEYKWQFAYFTFVLSKSTASHEYSLELQSFMILSHSIAHIGNKSHEAHRKRANLRLSGTMLTIVLQTGDACDVSVVA